MIVNNPADTMKVSIFTGCVVQRDAISNICRQQIDAIARYARLTRRCIQTKLYTGFTDVQDSRIFQISSVAQLVGDHYFHNSDIMVYHFGIRYPLFDSILLAPRTARVIGHFHGVTPPHLCRPEIRPTLFQSYCQAAHFIAADEVFVDSRYLMSELPGMSTELPPLVHMPPSVSVGKGPPTERPATIGDNVQLLYVGRFVQAKGVYDLLQAFQIAGGNGCINLRLDLIGSKTFSDRDFLTRLQAFVADHGLQTKVRFRFDVTDAELAEALQTADALVIPSYHEGFCVPVVEAYICGCFVICSDAGALPETSGGLGRTFPVRDAEQLAGRLEEFVRARQRGCYATDKGLVAAEEWNTAVAEYADQFSIERSQDRFCKALFQALPRRDGALRTEVARCRAQTFVEASATVARPGENTKASDLLRSTLALHPIAVAKGTSTAAPIQEQALGI